VVGQSATMVVLAAMSALGHTTPQGLVGASCVYMAFGQAAGTAWSSWMGDVVPPALRGRWFGSRNRLVSATTFVAIVVGGVLLHLTEPAAGGAHAGGGSGYAALYATAALLRLGGSRLLWGSWEPPFLQPDRLDDPVRVLSGSDGASGRAVVGIGAAMLVAVCIATPYFAPHMLQTLQFSYLAYLGSQALMVATKVVSLGPWGRLVDRFGAVPVFQVSAVLVAIVPIPWMLADRAWVVYLAQAFSGAAWAGNEVALLALTLSAADPRRRAVLLATQSVANGLAQVGGGLLGTVLAGPHPVTHAATFGASAAARLVVALTAPFVLRSLRRRGPVPWWDVGARVVAWLPNGGLVRQPVFPSLRPPRVVGAENPIRANPPVG
jgi:MFS family permease